MFRGPDLELSLEPTAADSVRKPQFVDAAFESLQPATTQIWDWTQDFEGDFCKLFEHPSTEELVSRVYQSQATQAAAAKLAHAIEDWHANPLNEGRTLTIVAGSGGASITVMAAEMLPRGSLFFERIIFISAALSTERSLERLHSMTKDGIYNYYSYNDATLQGFACEGAGPSRVLDFRWPAAGRFGYRRNNPNFRFVTAQLSWEPSYTSRYNNNGEHYNAYRREFFEEFVRPIILGKGAFPPWITREQGGIDPMYTDQLDTAGNATLLQSMPPILDITGQDLILIVPGHEQSPRLHNIENTISRHANLDVWLWDWPEADEIDDIDDEARLDPDVLKQAAATLTDAILRWRESNPTARLHVLAISSGTMIVWLACESASESILPDELFETITVSSGLLSSERTLDNLARCARRGIYNYYSDNNETLVGTSLHSCFDGFEANIEEFLNTYIYASIENPVKWPAGGRFGYFTFDHPSAGAPLLQIGWSQSMTRDTGNHGDHLDELDRRFVEKFYFPVWLDSELPKEWQADILDEYRDAK